MTPQIKAETLRALDPVRVAAQIAEKEADVARQEAIVEWLRTQADDEERLLWQQQRSLAEMRDIQTQMQAAS